MSVIDASVYVSLLDPDDPAYSKSWNWLQSAIENKLELVAPAIILAEVASALSRGVGDKQLAVRAVDELANSEIVRLKPVSVELAVRAADIAAQYKVRGCDAIYLALAEAGNTPLVTLDRQQFERGAAVVEVMRPGG